MIEVELPDGTIAEFPDGTPQEVMRSAIQRQMQSPSVAPKTDRLPEAAGDGGFLQTADDFMRAAANGLTFGAADRVAGFLGGDGTEAERAKSEAARERSPIASATGEIGGAVAGIGKLMNAGVTAGRLVSPALTGVPKFLATAGAGAADAVAFNELANAGYGREFGENAGLAAGLGAAAPGVADLATKAASRVAGAFRGKPAIPAIEDIANAKSAAYEAAKNAGVVYNGAGTAKLRDAIAQDMVDFGFMPELQPGAAVVLKQIQRIAGNDASLKGLDQIRKIAGNAYVPGNNSNNALIGKIIDRIDDMIAAGDDVIAGDGAAGASAIKEARALASRETKLKKLAEALNKADLRAASTGSGGNVDNATRQNLRRILEKPRGFTADEKAALETVVRGTGPQNALRLAGKLSPSGNGLMAALGVGGALANPFLGVASLGGMAAKSIADSKTQASVKRLMDIVAAGGSKAATEAPKRQAQLAIEAKRDILAKMLLGGGLAALPQR